MAQKRRFRIPIQLPIVLAVLTLAALSVYRWRVDQHGDPDHLYVSGTVEGEEVAIGSKIGGRLAELLVKEGDQVHAGQPIARFEAQELAAQQKQLQASIDAAKAQESKLEHGPRQQELAQAQAAVETARAQLAELQAGSRAEDIGAAEANWRAADSQFKLAEADLKRARELYESDVIPKSQLDAAQARMETTRQAAQSAREQYDKAQAGPRDTQIEIAHAQVRQAQAAYDLVAAGARREDIDAAKAQVAGTAAQLEALGIRIGEAEVAAPQDGVILTVNHQPGDLLLPNDAVANLLLGGSYYVQVFVPEEKLAWAAPGTPARLSVDSFPGQEFSGTVTYLSAEGEYTPRNLQTKEKRVEQTFRCKVKVDDASGRLRPGMVCDVVFDKPGSGGA